MLIFLESGPSGVCIRQAKVKCWSKVLLNVTLVKIGRKIWVGVGSKTISISEL